MDADERCSDLSSTNLKRLPIIHTIFGTSAVPENSVRAMTVHEPGSIKFVDLLTSW
jgi:hypothetical protein